MEVVIDNNLTWREQLEKVHKSFSSQYRLLKKMRYLSPNLMDAFYVKVVIPQTTYSLSVWGYCSVAKLTNVENLQIKLGRLIHSAAECFGQ